ncbi:hypothetical protein EDB86DRAFT_2921714 [Lactarius hatsudake]|nr:hypothetical protein EDB86DRAFT_2921714 [Lactarius hatsudake]
MIQTGDPLRDSTGGTSIWDRDFEDELPMTSSMIGMPFQYILSVFFHRPYAVSMANAGPNPNRSQFFIGGIEEVAFLRCSSLDFLVRFDAI